MRQPHTRLRRVLILVLAVLACLGTALVLVRSFTFTPDVPAPGAAGSLRCTTQAQAGEFVSEEDRFRAAFPCTPVRSSSSANTPFGKISIIRHETEANGTNYAVSFVDYASLVPGGELPDLLVSFILDGAKRGVLRDSGMENPTYADIRLADKYSGQSISASNAEKTLRAHVVIVGKATYQIVIVTPNALADQPLVDDFLRSFRVLD
jgi:hypothetical protein